MKPQVIFLGVLGAALSVWVVQRLLTAELKRRIERETEDLQKDAPSTPPKTTRDPISFHRDGPFAGLSEGTNFTRKDDPGVKWVVQTAHEPGTSPFGQLDPNEWVYDSVRVPSGWFDSPPTTPFPVAEHEIESVVVPYT